MSELAVSGCYNVGVVKSSNLNAKADEYNIGSLLGRSKAAVSNCYWLSESAELGIGYNNGSGDALSKAADELVALSNADLNKDFLQVESGFPALAAFPVFTVDFVADGKDGYGSQEVGAYMKLYQEAMPALTTGDFKGWYTDSDYQTEFDADGAIICNLTVYAKIGSGGNTGGSGTGAGSGSGSSGGKPDNSGAPDDTNGTNDKNYIFDPDCKGGVQCPSYSFGDVIIDSWYHHAVDYVLSNSIMQGTGNGIFEPNSVLTRAMLVTILYNLENNPPAAASGFGDVAGSSWYADAVNWAAEQGIVKGVSANSFAPNDSITREQMATIFYRYAEYKIMMFKPAAA